jgi:hypothetical protein
MTVRNISPANKTAKYSWTRLAMVNAAFLLVAIAAGGNAVAAVDCGSKPAPHAASTQCRQHHPRAGVHGLSKTQIIVRATATRAVDGDVLTPAGRHAPPTTVATSSVLRLPDVALPASTLVHRLGRAGVGPSPWRGHGAPAGNRLPPTDGLQVPARAVTAAAATSGSPFSLGDLLHVSGGGMPALPAPAGWTILLVGLLALAALARSPRVARVQSWATNSLSSAGR